jgi:hypothetical protein
MSSGTLAGVPFALDPESIAYHFDIKASSTQTVGGKVVQVFGTKVSNMNVTASFGSGGWRAQKTFLDGITATFKNQVGTLGPSGYKGGAPVRFTYPPRGWDFQVYILDYNQPGGTSSIILDNAIINPQWQLEMFIVDDNGGLKGVADSAMASYLMRLANGIGWIPNEYNGPVSTQNATTTPVKTGQVVQQSDGTIVANGYGY